MAYRPQLHFYYGAMGSSKTAQALMKAYNFRETGHKVLMAKPMNDIRTEKIWSRVGLEAECIPLEQIISMPISELEQYDILIVDEIQFALDSHIDFLAMLVDYHDISVYTFGLMLNYKGELFGGAKRVLELADRIVECDSVCWCGAPAKFSALLDENGKIKRAGEDKEYAIAGEYVPLCRKHYMSGKVGKESIIAETDAELLAREAKKEQRK